MAINFRGLLDRIKPDMSGGLLGKYIPNSSDMTDEEKRAISRQGLLALGAGLLAPSEGGGFGAALSNGITSGLLAMNDATAARANSGGGAEFRTLHEKAVAAGYQPGTPEYQRAVQINLGVLPRAVTGAARPQTIKGADGVERVGIFDPSTQTWSVYNGQSWVAAGPNQAPAIGADGQAVAQDYSNIFSGRPAEVEAGRIAEAQQAATLPYTMAEIGARTNAAIRAADITGQYGVRDALTTEQGKLDISSAGEDRKREATRSRDASTAVELAGAARAILPQATGGVAPAAYDTANAFFGRGTSGAQANAQLKTIAGQLTSKMPRMEGPQSDRDVEMYRQMAGDVGNENLPVSTRLAALDQIESLNRKYATQARPQSPATPAPRRPTAPQQGRPESQPRRVRYNPATGRIE